MRMRCRVYSTRDMAVPAMRDAFCFEKSEKQMFSDPKYFQHGRDARVTIESLVGSAVRNIPAQGGERSSAQRNLRDAVKPSEQSLSQQRGAGKMPVRST